MKCGVEMKDLNSEMTSLRQKSSLLLALLYNNSQPSEEADLAAEKKEITETGVTK